MKKFLVALSACLLTTPAFSSCWMVANGTKVPVASLDINRGKSSQTFTDANPNVPGNQQRTLDCVGFIDTRTGAETASCYDDGANLGMWIVLPDALDNQKAVGFFMIMPTLNPNGKVDSRPIKFFRCIKT